MPASISFGDGGIWMYVLVVWGLGLYGAVVAQLVSAKRRDFSQLLWGGLAALVLIGLLGTVIGFIQGMAALGNVPNAEMAALTRRVLAIAPLPTAFAALLAVPGATAIGIAGSLARKHAAAR